MSENKYKIFRNFMVNELGISKDEIKQWCQDAIKEEVSKLVGQIDINGRVKQTIESSSYKIISDSIGIVGKELANRLNITIKSNQ